MKWSNGATRRGDDRIGREKRTRSARLGVGDARQRNTAARAAFVIGQDGVVKYAEQTATPKDLPNFDAIKAALAK